MTLKSNMLRQSRVQNSINPPFSLIKNQDNILYLKVYVKPGAKQSKLVSMNEDNITVQVDAPPHDGEANAALVDYMRKIFGVRKSDIQLVTGHKSRDKIISLTHSDIIEKEKSLSLESFYQMCIHAINQEISK